MLLIFCLNTLVAKIYGKITSKKKKEVVSENALAAQTSSSSSSSSSSSPRILLLGFLVALEQRVTVPVKDAILG
jgi:hypothetical protein